MSVTAQTPVNSYTANGVTTVFNFSFLLLAAADLDVYIDNVLKTLTADYTISGLEIDSGGTVTFLTAPDNGASVVLQRNSDIARSTDYQDNGDMLAAIVNKDFDRLWLAMQEILYKYQLAPSLPPGSVLAGEITLPTPSAGKYLRWNVLENNLENGDPDFYAGAIFAEGSAIATASDIANTQMQAGKVYYLREYSSGLGKGGGELRAHAGAITPDNGLTFASGTPNVYAKRVNYSFLTDSHFASFQEALTICAANKIPLQIFNSHTISAPGVSVPSNSTVYFAPGVVISAAAGYGLSDVLIDFNGKSNVFWFCTGATFTMPKSEYVSGEHRHCFNLRSCTNITLIDPYSDGCGGDGFYINAAVNCKLYRAIANNSRRDGFSIIGATDLLMESPIARNIIGTSPECGINIEPNGTADKLINIVINNPRMENCNQNNFQIYLDDYKDGVPDDISITVNNPVSYSANWNGYRFSNIYVTAGSYGGHITITNPVSDSDGYDAISIVDKGVTAPILKIVNPVIINPCTNNAASPNNSGIYISDSSATISGAIAITDVSIRNDDLGMDYGIFIESGQGFSDLRITVDNIIGAVIDPVRWNNTSSTIADASDAIINVNALKKKTAITASSKNVTADLAGTILTNAGAAGTVTFFLRDYLPAGNKYRFQVETAQTIQVDVFDSADRIVGTTIAGAIVSTNVVGEACEVEYIGTLGGVRYWRLTILGKSTNWTFA